MPCIWSNPCTSNYFWLINIELDGLDISKETLKDLLSVDNELWLEDCKGIHEFYKQVGERVPAELYEELAALEARLAK